MASFQAPTRVIFDQEVGAAVDEILDREGWTRLGVVADAAVTEAPEVAALLQALEARCARYVLLRRSGPEPDVEDADRAAEALRGQSLDAIMGIGGGSTLDLAKAVAVLTTNDGSAARYQGFMLVERPGVPSVLIPTTAGTGSEVTWTAVLTNRDKAIKAGINSPHLLARYAVLDARLTLGMPKVVMVSTAMDALTHAVESFTARSATVVSRMVSRQAFELVYTGFAATLEDGADREARRQTLLGSTLAGLAILNAGTGACHSIAYALGSGFGVPHGTANALLLPAVMRVNERRAPGLYAPLWDVVHPEDRTLSATARSRRLSDDLERLVKAALPSLSLTEFGVGSRDLPALAETGLRLRTALDNNPVEFGTGECRDVLEAILT